MHVAHLTLHDFRSYADVDVELGPGATTFTGRNGQGKTNLVEAIDYLSRLSSHRVASDTPLIRAGAPQGLVRAAVVRDGRQALLEVELNPGRANRARINRSDLPRARELIGLVRTVVFSPDDLELVKGDPADRRRFLDDLLVLRSPRLAGVKADYDRVLKQRNSLLKSVGPARSSGAGREAALSTMAVWDEQLVRAGTEILTHRAQLVADLRPYLGEAYATVARGATREDAELAYRSQVIDRALERREPAQRESGEQSESSEQSEQQDQTALDPEQIAAAFTDLLAERQRDELYRGITLVGPHRDELELTLGTAPGQEGLRLPVKGYASHGESWSYALALRLASYALLRAEGDDPILILDDVFAELDAQRREQLAAMVAGAEQVLVTAAVAEDVPEALQGVRFQVAGGEVTREQ